MRSSHRQLGRMQSRLLTLKCNGVSVFPFPFLCLSFQVNKILLSQPKNIQFPFTLYDPLACIVGSLNLTYKWNQFLHESQSIQFIIWPPFLLGGLSWPQRRHCSSLAFLSAVPFKSKRPVINNEREAVDDKYQILNFFRTSPDRKTFIFKTPLP